MISKNPSIGFIGFGKVAYYLSLGLKKEGIKQIIAYARSATKPVKGEIIHKRAQDADVEITKTFGEVVTRSELVISVVNCNAALEVAKKTAHFIPYSPY